MNLLRQVEVGIANESIQSCGALISGHEMDSEAVTEVGSGKSVEHEVATIERACEVALATVGLTMNERKALLASLQEQIVTAQVFFAAWMRGFSPFVPQLVQAYFLRT